MHKLFVASSLLALSWGAYALVDTVRTNRRELADSRAAFSATSSELQQQTASLKRKLTRLESATHALQISRQNPSPTDTALVAPNAAPESSEQTDNANGAESAPDQPSLETRLEAAFSSDVAETEWTHDAPREVEEALTACLPSGSRISERECRGLLCRVEIEHATEGGHEDFIRSLMTSDQGWAGPGSFQRIQTPKGREATVAYLGKPGDDLEEGSVWR